MSRSETVQLIHALTTANTALDAHIQPLLTEWLSLQVELNRATLEEATLDYSFESSDESGVSFYHKGEYDFNDCWQTIPWEFIESPEIYASLERAKHQIFLKDAAKKRKAALEYRLIRINNELASVTSELSALEPEQEPALD